MSTDDTEIVETLKNSYTQMREQLGGVIVGQEEVIEQMLIAIFCRGHALLVGVPGLAKTLLVSTLSEVLDLSFKRVQFTPDLMPADITGTEVLEEDHTTGKRMFRFVKGPIFANMLLADEINRTPPKTQAALLEAMQEHHVTVGEETMALPEPFFVLATQNPIEQEGTYPLPEAQLDRFMFNIYVDYPTKDEESQIIKQVTGTYQADLKTILNAEQVMELQTVVRRVPVADHVVDYAASLARASRPKSEDAPDFVKEMVSWGAGPRAGIALITAAKARGDPVWALPCDDGRCAGGGGTGVEAPGRDDVQCGSGRGDERRDYQNADRAPEASCGGAGLRDGSPVIKGATTAPGV